MKKKVFFGFIFISLYSFLGIKSSLAQSHSQKDTLAKYSYEELSKKFYAAKPDSLKAILYAKYYIKKAKRDKDTLQEADGNYYLSDITNNLSHFINYWNKIIQSTKNKIYPAKAYLELGEFYRVKGFHNIALTFFLKAKNELKSNKNDSLNLITIHRLGHLKAQNRQIEEAIYLYKKVYNSYFTKRKIKNISNEHYSILVSLSSNFAKLKSYDSAVYYNSILKKLAIKNKNELVLGYSINNTGRLFYRQKKYHNAIKELKYSISYLIDDENYNSLSYTYLLIANSYLKIRNESKALKYYFLIDSLFDQKKYFFSSQRTPYKYLISHFKKENNDAKQLEYINKYLKVDSVLNARSKSINKNLTENYDIPNLLAERKLIEDRLKNKLSNFEKWMWGTSSIALIFLVFLLLQIRKRKRYKKRFNELVHNHKEHSTTVSTVSKKENTIPKEITKQILIQLNTFEINNEYISSEITLNNLAKKLNTNSKYLSQVINQHKNQSFSNYVNQLRINYTIERLKKDAKFRKYSVKAIAYEVGFNTTESFSKAFYKFTKIKPSFFIKELEK